MRRYFIFLKFKGTEFNGWQTQPNGITVQEEIEKALAVYFQQTVPIMGSGRTDAGVHAKLMIAHFDYDKNIVINDFIYHVNNILNESISIISLNEVLADFHARFAAESRTYHYFLVESKDPFTVDFSHRIIKELDFDRMNEAAKLLLGEKDFSCFSKSKTQTFTNNCDITKAAWTQQNELWRFEITANRFLRNMVRAIVGTLIEVGEGKRTVESILI